MNRCDWAKNDLAIIYHDAEWGVPVREDQKLFEFLILEGAQAGLNWDMILRKRENYRAAFDYFDAEKIAQYDESKIAELLQNEGIVRNRLKIASTIQNAKSFLRAREEFGSFDKYIWRFVNGEPIKNVWKNLSEVPANTSVSDAMSKDLKKRGFNFYDFDATISGGGLSMTLTEDNHPFIIWANKTRNVLDKCIQQGIK